MGGGGGGGREHKKNSLVRFQEVLVHGVFV